MSIPFSGEPFAPPRKPPRSRPPEEPPPPTHRSEGQSHDPRSPGSAQDSRTTATATATDGRFDSDKFFGRQPTPTELLPPPEPLLENLTRCVMEVLRGARDIDQLGRWISEDVYKHLLTRQLISARARQIKGTPATRPVLVIGRISTSSPADGVIEAVVMVYEKPRARAVAIRLEGVDRRWRATSIGVL